VIVATEYQGIPEALGQAGAERLRQFPVVRWRADKPNPWGC
jgi:hypothetical protein